MRSSLGRRFLPCFLASFVTGASACGASIEGTYAAAAGDVSLDLMPEGRAAFTVLGDTQTCTYARDAARLTLTCPGPQTFAFSIAADGSLASEGAGIGTLRKTR